jgi:hypothetical protein
MVLSIVSMASSTTDAESVESVKLLEIFSSEIL